MSPWLFPAIAVSVGLVAAVTDLSSGRIPNKLTLTAILVGWIGHGCTNGVVGLLQSLSGAVACAAIPAVVYRISQGHGIGGGDIKLFAALGALLGPTQGLEAELSAFLLIGAYAMFRLAFVGQLGRTLLRSLRVAGGLFVPKLRRNITIEYAPAFTSMRMGPAILLAVLTTVSMPQLSRWLTWLG